MSTSKVKPAEIVCYMTTAGLIVLALAFAFHTDAPATHAAVNAAIDLARSAASAATAPTPVPTP